MGSIDRSLALSLARELVRGSLAVNDLVGLISSLQGYSHLVDQDFARILAGEAALARVETVLPVSKVHHETERMMACIEGKAPKLRSMVKALSYCLEVS